MMKNKGFFAFIVCALLILITIQIIFIKINYYNKETNLEKELIEIKNLSYTRSEFEYNIQNAIKLNLDNLSLITQEQPILKESTDNLVKQILNDYGFYYTLNSGLLITIFSCGINNCLYYKYSILLPISKELSKENKTIELRLPINFSIENTVILP
jgi:hypothetical protein